MVQPDDALILVGIEDKRTLEGLYDERYEYGYNGRDTRFEFP